MSYFSIDEIPGLSIQTDLTGKVVKNPLHQTSYPDMCDVTDIQHSGLDPHKVSLCIEAIQDGSVNQTFIDKTDRWYLVNVKRTGDMLVWLLSDMQSFRSQVSDLSMDIDQFTHIISHDLQEPIRTITSYIDILMEDHSDVLSSNPEILEYMGYIRASALRQQRLIQDLLSYNKSSQLTFTKASIKNCFDNAVSSLHDMTNRRSAVISWESGDVQTVMAPTWIEVVFQNLISNSIKYCNKRPYIKCGFTETHTHYVLYVKDNGIGIAPEYKEQVFKMFKRLYDLKDQEGTGIGLAICRKIARKHGGECYFESVVGSGTTFYLSINKSL
jgi:signal transduction histidine kinase